MRPKNALVSSAALSLSDVWYCVDMLCYLVMNAQEMDDKQGGGAAAIKPVPGAPPPAVLTAIDIMLREWTRVEAGTYHYHDHLIIRYLSIYHPV